MEGGVQCLSCKGHRNSLHAIAARIEKSKASKENGTSASSHVNYIHLSSPEKNRRLSTLHQVVRTVQRQVGRLRARLNSSCWGSCCSGHPREFTIDHDRE